jgi:hypothetical protein
MMIRNVLAAAVAGLALWLTVPGTTPAAEVGGESAKVSASTNLRWKYFGSYRSYSLAEAIADELEDRGYDTQIIYDSGYYEVWYR